MVPNFVGDASFTRISFWDVLKFSRKLHTINKKSLLYPATTNIGSCKLVYSCEYKKHECNRGKSLLIFINHVNKYIFETPMVLSWITFLTSTLTSMCTRWCQFIVEGFHHHSNIVYFSPPCDWWRAPFI